MKISFLSPAYNSSEWLVTMLNSIPKEYAHEIIVCDDGSTDATLNILRDYQRYYPVLKIIENGTNLGASESYNRLIKEATGDYIAIIDSDDHYLPAILDVLKQVDGTYDIYYYNMYAKAGYCFFKHESNILSLPGQFKIIRRSFIGDAKFTTRSDFAGDWDFTRVLMENNPTSLYTGILAYWYNYPRENSESDLHGRGLK